MSLVSDAYWYFANNEKHDLHLHFHVILNVGIWPLHWMYSLRSDCEFRSFTTSDSHTERICTSYWSSVLDCGLWFAIYFAVESTTRSCFGITAYCDTCHRTKTKKKVMQPAAAFILTAVERCSFRSWQHQTWQPSGVLECPAALLSSRVRGEY